MRLKMKCSIDSNTREIIFLDNSECFGVEFDKNTQRIEFSCPKIVGDNLDLTKCICRINYMNAKGYRDSYLIDDVLADGDNIIFTWKLKGKVTAGRGNCLFIFCARQVNENGVIEKEWNTTVAKASIKRGLETNSHIEEEYSDILESILLKINSVSLTTEVNAESTNENVPTAKAVYDALQDIDIPSGTDISLGVTATVGQTIKVKAVDADGKPTAWEAVDMAAGDTDVWELINTLTITEENAVAMFAIDKDSNGKPFSLKKATMKSLLTNTKNVPLKGWLSFNGRGVYNSGVHGFVTPNYLSYTVANYGVEWGIEVVPKVSYEYKGVKQEFSSTTQNDIHEIEVSRYQNNETLVYGTIELWGVRK
jgi:hypothetical protein